MPIFIQGGSSGMTKKLLWTNPNPTVAWANTSFRINEHWGDYTHILVECRISTTDQTIAEKIYAPVNLIKEQSAQGTVCAFGNFGYCGNVRNIGYGDIKDYKGFLITNCYGVDSTTSRNNNLIPVRIYGVKISGG